MPPRRHPSPRSPLTVHSSATHSHRRRSLPVHFDLSSFPDEDPSSSMSEPTESSDASTADSIRAIHGTVSLPARQTSPADSLKPVQSEMEGATAASIRSSTIQEASSSSSSAPPVLASPVATTSARTPSPLSLPAGPAASPTIPSSHPRRIVRQNGYATCLFIANIDPAHHDDLVRRAATAHFERFGEVVQTKVRRENEIRPYGQEIWTWVWMKDEAAAQRALEGAHRTPLLGRTVRVERAKAYRNVLVKAGPGGSFVFRADAEDAAAPATEGQTSTEEAQGQVPGRWILQGDNGQTVDTLDELGKFGVVEDIRLKSVEQGPSSGLDVRFETRDDAISALYGLREDLRVELTWTHDASHQAGQRFRGHVPAHVPAFRGRSYFPRGGSGFRGGGVRGRGGHGPGARGRALPDRVSTKEPSTAGSPSLHQEGSSLSEGRAAEQWPALPGTAAPQQPPRPPPASTAERLKPAPTQMPPRHANLPRRPAPAIVTPPPTPITSELQPSTIEGDGWKATLARTSALEEAERSRSGSRPLSRYISISELFSTPARAPPSINPASSFVTPVSLPSSSRRDRPLDQIASSLSNSSGAPVSGLRSPASTTSTFGSPLDTPSSTYPARFAKGTPSPPNKEAIARRDAIELASQQPRTSPADDESLYLVDPCSIFVGGLNKDEWNQQRLVDVFQVYGKIKDVEWVGVPTNSYAGFAFLTFWDRIAARTAVDSQNGQIYAGYRMRVQLRIVQPGRSQRLLRGSEPTSPPQHQQLSGPAHVFPSVPVGTSGRPSGYAPGDAGPAGHMGGPPRRPMLVPASFPPGNATMLGYPSGYNPYSYLESQGIDPSMINNSVHLAGPPWLPSPQFGPPHLPQRPSFGTADSAVDPRAFQSGSDAQGSMPDPSQQDLYPRSISSANARPQSPLYASVGGPPGQAWQAQASYYQPQIDPYEAHLAAQQQHAHEAQLRQPPLAFPYHPQHQFYTQQPFGLYPGSLYQPQPLDRVGREANYGPGGLAGYSRGSGHRYSKPSQRGGRVQPALPPQDSLPAIEERPPPAQAPLPPSVPARPPPPPPSVQPPPSAAISAPARIAGGRELGPSPTDSSTSEDYGHPARRFTPSPKPTTHPASPQRETLSPRSTFRPNPTWTDVSPTSSPPAPYVRLPSSSTRGPVLSSPFPTTPGSNPSYLAPVGAGSRRFSPIQELGRPSGEGGSSSGSEQGVREGKVVPSEGRVGGEGLEAEKAAADDGQRRVTEGGTRV